MPATYTSYQSRIPYVMTLIEHQVDQVVERVADRIVEEAQARVPQESGRLHDAIHKEHRGVGEYAVLAGDDEVFWGHMVEFGTVKANAHPFLVPAAEAASQEINSIGARTMRAG